MADTEALESIPGLLPPERRERFLLIASKYRDLAEDDDHLQMLETAGFLTLLMKEVLAEMGKLLNETRRGLNDGQSAQLRTELVEVLESSLDTPSYKDLRETVMTIRDQESRFSQKVGDICNRMVKFENSLEKEARRKRSILQGFVGGIVVLAGVAIALFVGFPSPFKPEPLEMPAMLHPYVITLYNRGELGYSEIDLPEFEDNVGLFFVGGDVISAFVDGTKEVVVISPLSAAGQRVRVFKILAQLDRHPMVHHSADTSKEMIVSLEDAERQTWLLRERR